MWGRSAIVLLAIIAVLQDPILGRVIRGCKYEGVLCGPNSYCFDDGGTGICVKSPEEDENDPEEAILKRLLEQQRLEEALKSLTWEGYTSSDPYWKCVLANVMRHYDYPHRKDCSEYAKVNDDKRTEDSDNEEEPPIDVASINYSPSSRDSHSQFADELYSPLFLGQLEVEDLTSRNRERVSDPVWRERSEEGERSPYRDSPTQLIRQLQRELERERLEEELKRTLDNEARVIAVKKSAPTPIPSEYWIPYSQTDKLHLLQEVIREENERERAAAAALEALASPDEDEVEKVIPLSVAADQAESSEPIGRFSDTPFDTRKEFLQVYNSPELFREGFESRDALPQTYRESLDQEDADDDDEDPAGLSERVYAYTPRPMPDITGFNHEYNTPDNFRAGVETRDDVNIPFDRLSFLQREDDSADDQTMRKQGLEFLASLLSDAEWPEDRPNKQFAAEQLQKKKKSQHDLERAEVSQLVRAAEDEAKEIPEEILAEEQAVEGAPGRAYTEGGLVFLQDQENPHEPGDPSGGELRLNPSLDDGLSALLALGFKRRERLDVKKPGPPFLTNSYAYGDVAAAAAAAAAEPETPDSDVLSNREVRAEVQRGEPVALAQKAGPNLGVNYKDRFGIVPEQKNAYTVPPNSMPIHRNSQKKTSSGSEESKGSGTAASAGTGIVSDFEIGVFPTEDDQSVDGTVVTVTFKDKLTSWVEGEEIIVNLANAVNVYAGSFIKRRVYPYKVSFKVDEQQAHMNASEIAQQIMNNKDALQRSSIHFTILSAEVGEKENDVESHPVFSDMFNKLSITVLVAVVSLAVILSAVTIHSIRTYRRRIDKLCGLAQPDTEASKDYQDLCRARMSKKTEHEKPEPLHVDQRVASLSRESEGSNTSPSNRSSTSSWSEEPAISNMDISTGHMVLAYMEDHLKNKDRLEQEWRALCAYEAEPCETTVANLAQNVKKNRYYPHVLPYDHSRVVLCERANVSNSDYINASTITDHDPRNPAYLATQGPLEHTIPDFWQLVWEQGSVVMVMLTRLTENGTSMCQRYWPEEGSELYHIYEVHLVSEHIWCDDYLVRSFYLKNLMTSETRTVTQFHFLSWPEHGVPTATKPLLDFRRKVNKSYRGRSCPIVVHCSDGAGRTGTYCLIDMVLNRMSKGAKEIDIAATLEHIRDQRPNMVESKEQFEFCLAAVADEVHAILKALPSQPTPPLPATTAATSTTPSTSTTTSSTKTDQEKTQSEKK